MEDAGPIGRGGLLGRARAQLARGGSVLFFGPAGIGKSTLVRTLAAEAAAAGERILRVASAEADANLPFLALIDLLSPVEEEFSRRLPTPQRAALDAALLRSSRPAGSHEQLAVRLAVLYLLRALTEQGPVLLAVDDLQWVDRASGEVLAFVARRLGGLPIRMVAAERVADGDYPIHQDLCPTPLLELPVGPLSAGELAELLRRLPGQRDGEPFPRRTVESIHQASGGNPFFAAEIGRALLRRGTPLAPGEPLPVPRRLRALMLDRLGALSPSARQTLLLAAAAARPGWPLLLRLGRRQVDADLAEAAELGIADVDHDGVVRFTHPLLSATLYGDASPGQRRAAHALLAKVTTDPVERARHLALATPGEDEDVAATLVEAAESAYRRGAPAVAAELLLLAADRTPPDLADRATERRLRGAMAALDAGRWDEARRAADEVLRVAADPPRRVRASLIRLDAQGQALARADALFQQALADAGDDPKLQAPVRLRMAMRILLESSWKRAAVEASRAARMAAEAGDPETQLRALNLQALCELGIGSPAAAQTYSHALALEYDPARGPLNGGPRQLRARFDLYADRLDTAREELRALIRLAEERGGIEDLVSLLLLRAEVEVRAGNCGDALEVAYRGLRLVEDAGLSRGPALYGAALAEAAGGDVRRARELAEQGARISEADHDQTYLLRSLCVLGHAALVAGDAPAAVGPLRRAQELERAMGVVDPALFRWHADLAEALVATGELEAAADLVDTTRAHARRLGRHGVLAALDRVAILLRVTQRDSCDGAAVLRSAAKQLRGLPLECGRTLLALGIVERRRRRRAAARAAFAEAYDLFERCGAAPWLERTRAETARIGGPVAGRAGGGTEPLTDTELRIARLVAAGATNREVAAQLFLSVKTVESNLTRIYRKLSVRSRTELAGALRREGDHDPPRPRG